MNHRKASAFESDGYIFRYRDETTGRHWKMIHTHQGIEMLYIHEGCGEITVEGNHYPLQKGTLVLFQPYQLHRVEAEVQEGQPYIRTNFTFDPHLAEPWLAPFPRLSFFYRNLWKGVLKQQVFQIPEDEKLPQLLLDFHLAHERPAAELEEERGLFLLNLLRYLQTYIFADQMDMTLNADRSMQHAEKAMDWIEKHFAEPFRLQNMADDLHLSPYYLSHLFKQSTGQTITDYIAARRVREACALLMTTTKPIKAISREVGVFSDAYFCQLFKKWKGITPQAYRETVRRRYAAQPAKQMQTVNHRLDPSP